MPLLSGLAAVLLCARGTGGTALLMASLSQPGVQGLSHETAGDMRGRQTWVKISWLCGAATLRRDPASSCGLTMLKPDAVLLCSVPTSPWCFQSGPLGRIPGHYRVLCSHASPRRVYLPVMSFWSQDRAWKSFHILL